MTHTTLSRQLKTLEEEGLIQRIEYSQIPPKVEYSLTSIGKKFEKVLDALGEWGEEYIDYLNQKNCQKNSDFLTSFIIILSVNSICKKSLSKT